MGYNDNPTASDTREAMQVLLAAGVVTVKVSFSGGNDEGGPDGTTFLDAAGNEVTRPLSHAHEGTEWNPDTKAWESVGWIASGPWDREAGRANYRSATDEEVQWAKVAAVLEAPIYDRWGSFAGEFYVHGTCTWDVATGTHRLTGQESHEEYDDFSYEG